MSLAWAKCPSAWAQIKNRAVIDLDAVPDKADSYLPAEDSTHPHPSGTGFLPGLSHLRWREHKGAGTAAIMLLFALAIRSNLNQREFGLRQNNLVSATYDELQELTLLSREMVAKGLSLLRELGAITSKRAGNRCEYELIGIETNGKWCKLPQDHLMEGRSVLRRLAGMRETIKRRTSLDAMKLYMLLLVYRGNKTNVVHIGYEAIRAYTGMRRPEIAIAVQLLQGAQLCRLAVDEEVPLRKGERKHNRYVISGLNGEVT
jgi:DNA-binding transcriptional ArsR family regulator